MLSRVTNRSGIKLINFSPDSICANTDAIQELDRMRQNALFKWQHPLTTLSTAEVLHVGHINIRSLELHLNDLIADKSLQNLSVLCLTETHVKEFNLTDGLPGFKHLCTPSAHGLMMFVKNTYAYQELDFKNCKLEIMGIMINVSTESIAILNVYKPPKLSVTDFLGCLEFELQGIIEQYKNIIITGDFNMQPDNQQVCTFMNKLNLFQCVTEVTHTLGSTLDLLFHSFDEKHILNSGSFPLPYTDHYVIWTTFDLQTLK